MRCLPTTLALLVLALPAAAVERSEEVDFEVEIVAEGLEHPWALAFLPDGDMLVTERPGRLLRVAPNGSSEVIGGVPEVMARNQGGLLDVALHPDFADNRLVYLSYSEPRRGGSVTAVGRGALRNGALTDFEVIFRATPPVDSSKHFGSRLAFDGDGYLFVTSGERGRREHAQAMDKYHGKVIRLLPDGSIPDGNPYVGQQGVQPGIYSYGHRNPQGMIVHPPSGRIWVNEHGPRGGDEVNIVEPGGNYGWPEVTYGREYYGPEIGPDTRPDVVDPIHQWTPSIAPSGMAWYQGDAFPDWRGDLFVGALALTHLARLELDGERVVGEERLLEDRNWRIRDVRAGPDGMIYLLVDAADAPLVRLVPADGA
ncbi:PQQ-dependent sugar dehydrogenase [Sediminicurvatus halobius]|uniref:Glucose/Sorbosone dehydrogenase domain-containing protein n=1 Tax=Sediminicurvatus halobius TaxID=2182432 RepID=A0A2U2N3B2_9GAMM|nr:PQQ-dependent sugar dehydrogenase [Spiribacter halobius]PWG63705.1 hypothetical protein DEM34_07450 [Spiribacter halobius]UEX79843.1 PQQ-dependent sugar dehydrogenase [Spiribacter halobius]